MFHYVVSLHCTVVGLFITRWLLYQAVMRRWPKLSHWQCSKVSSSVLCGVQGLICSLVSLRTVTICTDMLVDKDEVIAVYLMFMGFFFIYDLVAMFMDFLARCREVGRYEGVLDISLRTNVKLFVMNEVLLTAHHVGLSTFIPVVLYMWSGRGSYIVGAMLLAEISTPFYTCRNIMKTVGHDSGILYTVNGLLFIATFFIGRIYMTPFLIHKYINYKNITLTALHTSLPCPCILGSMASIILNSYWFFMIVRTVYGKVRKTEKEE